MSESLQPSHRAELSRRALFKRSLAGACLAETIIVGPETASAATADRKSTVVCGFDAPSNALVTGVDPEELVLFAFDDHSIPLRSKMDLNFTEPELYEGNPVLKRGEAGEVDAFFAALYGTVFYLDGKFRMWYCAVDSWEGFEPDRANLRIAYAESEDGIKWVKPKLNLREFKESKENNLVGYNRDCYNPMIIFDPEDPDDAKRFKMVHTGYNHPSINSKMASLCVAYSPDGLKWTEHEQNPVVRTIWTEVGGFYRWNGTYYANGQSAHPPVNPKRTMITFASGDTTNWEEAAAVSFHRQEKQPEFNVGRQVHVGASVWHRKNVLLGLYGAWECPPTNKTADVRMNLGFIISNDGVLFREPVPDHPFIRYGAEKSGWKTVRLLQANAFVNHGEKTYIWYGAGVAEHQAVENECEVGLATLERDRFAFLTARKIGSYWTSQPLPAIAGGAKLAINADGLGENAHIEIEILDKQFVPLPGFSGEKAAVVKKSGLREPVTWSDAQAVFPDAPWRIRARFTGESATTDIRFYCLYIKPANV